MASAMVWLVMWLEAEFSSTLHPHLIHLKGKNTSFLKEAFGCKVLQAPYWFRSFTTMLGPKIARSTTSVSVVYRVHFRPSLYLDDRKLSALKILSRITS